MLRIHSFLTSAVLIVAASCLSACGSADRSDATYAGAQSTPPRSAPQVQLARPVNTHPVRAHDLTAKLEAAGLQVEPMGAAQIDTDARSRFPEEPRFAVVLRVSDGKGNSSPMTFVEFGSWKAAAELDAKPINGFAVRNWFVLGIQSNYFVDLVRDALAD